MDRSNNKKKLKDFIDSNIYKKQSRLILLQKQVKCTDEEKKEMEKLDSELNILYQIEEICEERGRY